MPNNHVLNCPRPRSKVLARFQTLQKASWTISSAILRSAVMRKASDNRLLPAAGLLLQWVESVGGRAALGKVVSLKEGSPEAVARAVGMEPPAMRTAFRQWVELLLIGE